MTARHLLKFRAVSTIGAMAGSLLLFGCGGGSPGSEGSTEQTAAVRTSETASQLSVAVELPSNLEPRLTEVQSLHQGFAASVTSGPNTGVVLAGSLMLNGQRQGNAATEMTGQLLPSLLKPSPVWASESGHAATVSQKAANPDPSTPSRSALNQQFEMRKEALNLGLRQDLKALSVELQQAVAEAANTGPAESTTAQNNAVAKFQDRFEQLASSHHEDVGTAYREYLGQATRKPTAESDADADSSDDDGASAGHDVRGTVDAQGAVSLKIDLRDGGTILANGQTAADGSIHGSFTGPGPSDSGTWSTTSTPTAGVATAAAAAMPCASQAVKWSVGSTKTLLGKSNCKATYPGGASGSSAAVSDVTAPAKGTATSSCTDGVVTTTAITCATPLPDCASFAVSWTVAGATCKATYAGGRNGSSALLSDIVAPAQGTVTATCTNGAVTQSALKCTLVGDPVKGQIVFNTATPVSCANGGCHAGFPTTKPNNIAKGTTTAALNAAYRNVSAMAGFRYQTTLTSQQTLDLAAYIAANP